MLQVPRFRSAVSLTRILLLLGLFGFDWRGYWVYSREEATGGVGPYLDLAHGIGPAPFQYRVGVIKVADLLYAHLHFPFRYSFALFDALASFAAVMLGYELLRRTAVFRRAHVLAQWLGSAAFAALVFYALAWQDTYKKSETEPSAALLMLSFALWFAPGSRGDAGQRENADGEFGGIPPALRAFGLLLLTVALALLRADLALCLNVGMLAASLLRRRPPLALSRGWAVATSCAGAVLAVVMQGLLIKVFFPHARHYDSAVFMLPHDIGHPMEVAQFLVYIAPAVWGGVQVWRRRWTGDPASLGLLLGSVPFVLLWATLGRLEEVRIFLPFAVALVPLICEMTILQAEDAAGEAQRTAGA